MDEELSSDDLWGSGEPPVRNQSGKSGLLGKQKNGGTPKYRQQAVPGAQKSKAERRRLKDQRQRHRGQARAFKVLDPMLIDVLGIEEKSQELAQVLTSPSSSTLLAVGSQTDLVRPGTPPPTDDQGIDTMRMASSQSVSSNKSRPVSRSQTGSGASADQIKRRKAGGPSTTQLEAAPTSGSMAPPASQPSGPRTFAMAVAGRAGAASKTSAAGVGRPPSPVPPLRLSSSGRPSLKAPDMDLARASLVDTITGVLESKAERADKARVEAATLTDQITAWQTIPNGWQEIKSSIQYIKECRHKGATIFNNLGSFRHQTVQSSEMQLADAYAKELVGMVELCCEGTIRALERLPDSLTAHLSISKDVGRNCHRVIEECIAVNNHVTSLGSSARGACLQHKAAAVVNMALSACRTIGGSLLDAQRLLMPPRQHAHETSTFQAGLRQLWLVAVDLVALAIKGWDALALELTMGMVQVYRDAASAAVNMILQVMTTRAKAPLRRDPTDFREVLNDQWYGFALDWLEELDDMGFADADSTSMSEPGSLNGAWCGENGGRHSKAVAEGEGEQGWGAAPHRTASTTIRFEPLGEDELNGHTWVPKLLLDLHKLATKAYDQLKKLIETSLVNTGAQPSRSLPDSSRSMSLREADAYSLLDELQERFSALVLANLLRTAYVYEAEQYRSGWVLEKLKDQAEDALWLVRAYDLGSLGLREVIADAQEELLPESFSAAEESSTGGALSVMVPLGSADRRMDGVEQRQRAVRSLFDLMKRRSLHVVKVLLDIRNEIKKLRAAEDWPDLPELPALPPGVRERLSGAGGAGGQGQEEEGLDMAAAYTLLGQPVVVAEEFPLLEAADAGRPPASAPLFSPFQAAQPAALMLPPAAGRMTMPAAAPAAALPPAPPIMLAPAAAAMTQPVMPPRPHLPAPAALLPAAAAPSTLLMAAPGAPAMSAPQPAIMTAPTAPAVHPVQAARLGSVLAVAAAAAAASHEAESQPSFGAAAFTALRAPSIEPHTGLAAAAAVQLPVEALTRAGSVSSGGGGPLSWREVVAPTSAAQQNNQHQAYSAGWGSPPQQSPQQVEAVTTPTRRRAGLLTQQFQSSVAGAASAPAGPVQEDQPVQGEVRGIDSIAEGQEESGEQEASWQDVRRHRQRPRPRAAGAALPEGVGPPWYGPQGGPGAPRGRGRGGFGGARGRGRGPAGAEGYSRAAVPVTSSALVSHESTGSGSSSTQTRGSQQLSKPEPGGSRGVSVIGVRGSAAAAGPAFGGFPSPFSRQGQGVHLQAGVAQLSSSPNLWGPAAGKVLPAPPACLVPAPAAPAPAPAPAPAAPAMVASAPQNPLSVDAVPAPFARRPAISTPFTNAVGFPQMPSPNNSQLPPQELPPSPAVAAAAKAATTSQIYSAPQANGNTATGVIPAAAISQPHQAQQQQQQQLHQAQPSTTWNTAASVAPGAQSVPLGVPPPSSHVITPADAAYHTIPLKVLQSNLMGATQRRGSFATVVKAQYDQLDVIVKFIDTHDKEDSQVLPSFKHEVDLHRRLNVHSNIVRLIGSCLEYGKGTQLFCALVMEHCELGDLHTRISMAREYGHTRHQIMTTSPTPDAALADYKTKSKPSQHTVSFFDSWDARLQVLISAAAGVRAMHRLRIVHRDLTSSNLVLKREFVGDRQTRWVAKVCDFGLSVALPPGQDRVENNNIYSPLWAAPELLDVPGQFGLEADVYSFGIIIYEVLTLRTPYADFSDSEPYSSLDHRTASGLVSSISGQVRNGLRPQLPHTAAQLTAYSTVPLHNDAQKAEQLYSRLKALTERCWETDPCARPTMEEVTVLLSNTLSSRHT